MEELLTSVERRYLAGIGHDQKPVVHVGHEAVTLDVVESTRLALAARELIKVRINPNCDEDRKELARDLAEQTDSQVVRIVGRTIMLFKQKTKKSNIEFPPDVVKKAKARRKRDAKEAAGGE